MLQPPDGHLQVGAAGGAEPGALDGRVGWGHVSLPREGMGSLPVPVLWAPLLHEGW